MRSHRIVFAAALAACSAQPADPSVGGTQPSLALVPPPPTPASAAPPRTLAPEQPLASAGAATPWHAAAQDGDVAKLNELIASDPAGIDSPNERGLTPLHLASARSLEAAKLLLDAGAKVRARGITGVTPLYVAARMNQPLIAELLLEGGAAVDERGPDANTPLHQASFRAALAVVDLLLHDGADPRNAAG